MRGGRGAAGGGHRAAPAPDPVQAPDRPGGVLLLVLLIIAGLAGLAGLHGAVTGLRWDGPLHRDAVVVGLVLEFVFGVMLAIMIRRLAVRAGAVAVKLRWMLVFVIGAGMIAIAATMVAGLHEHLFSRAGSGRPGQSAEAAPSSPAAGPGRHSLFLLHLHVPAGLLSGLLVLTFACGLVLRVWWVRRFRRFLSPGQIRTYGDIGNDPRDLRDAVRAGRSALRAIDEARAAIIGCYLAMEASLARHGTARADADTPDELLSRATATGIVRGTAAARLTALFYEARFSSHPMDRGQRDAAEQALRELVAANRSGARA